MIESLAQGDIDSARGANRKFHYVFYRAADSPFLLKLLGMLWARVPWDTALLAEGRSEHSLVEHQAIIEATLSGDSKAAGRAMRNHIEKGGEVIIRSFDETK